MTPFDLLEIFDDTTGKIALVATYDFDALFLARRVLRRLAGLGLQSPLSCGTRRPPSFRLSSQALPSYGRPPSGSRRASPASPISKSSGTIPCLFATRVCMIVWVIAHGRAIGGRKLKVAAGPVR